MKSKAWALALGFLTALPNAGSAEVIAKHHMIVAADPYAAEAGLEILRAGGSAVDAAITAQLVLTLVEPQSSGIGGGLFMVLSDGKGHLNSFDGREMAPASASSSMYLSADGRPRGMFDVAPGGITVGVPGTVAALYKAHQKYGRLPWARLFATAIRLSEQGFKVPHRLAVELATGPAKITQMPDMQALFFHADGSPVQEGETLRNPALGKAFRLIAKEGPRAFYNGPIGEAIIAAVSHAPVNPAAMTRADLQEYRAAERPALCGTYRGYRICAPPPPTSGGVTTMEILGLLQGFSSSNLQPGTLSAVHLTVEASRLAYADRARWLGDPAFVNNPVEGLLDPDYLATRAKLIDPTKDMGLAEAGQPPVKHAELLDYAPQRGPALHGTSHVSVVDDKGETVAMTMSIQSGFGSGLIADGFILNDELTDFSFEPEIDGRLVANAPAPHKRPLSSMAPTLVFDPNGKFFAALGSPGGRQIIAYMAEALSAVIDGKLSMPEAVALPHFVNTNGETALETGTDLAKLAPQLTAMGHTIAMRDEVSGLNGIRKIPGGYEGGSDPRRDSVSMGD